MRLQAYRDQSTIRRVHGRLHAFASIELTRHRLPRTPASTPFLEFDCGTFSRLSPGPFTLGCIMLLIVIRILYAFVCAGSIVALLYSDATLPPIVENNRPLTFLILLPLTQGVTLLDILIRKKRVEIISAIYFGLLIGVLLAYLLMLALQPVLLRLNLHEWSPFINILSPAILAYFSISWLLQTKDDFRFVIPYVEFARDLKGGRPLILDSSALIDGRIADVVDTKIIDAKLVVPSFVLKEVQDIADSSDKGRRTRGRRGLDVLARLRAIAHTEVELLEVDDRDVKGKTVDQRLVVLAKDQGGLIVTSDFNLNKVAALQGVDVINLNDVAAALRPRFLHGDIFRVKVMREGEGAGQGVGFLDDGTMVVVEFASSLINQEIEVIVTSVLQSSAGRMIFARPNNAEGTPPSSSSQDRGRAKH